MKKKLWALCCRRRTSLCDGICTHACNLHRRATRHKRAIRTDAKTATLEIYSVQASPIPSPLPASSLESRVIPKPRTAPRALLETIQSPRDTRKRGESSVVGSPRTQEGEAPFAYRVTTGTSQVRLAFVKDTAGSQRDRGRTVGDRSSSIRGSVGIWKSSITRAEHPPNLPSPLCTSRRMDHKIRGRTPPHRTTKRDGVLQPM
jgi:hypothetical protein